MKNKKDQKHHRVEVVSVLAIKKPNMRQIITIRMMLKCPS